MSLINILHNNSLKGYLPSPKAKLAQFQFPDIDMYGAPKTVNEKLLMFLIPGGNWFAIMTIPHVYRIVVPGSFPLLAMLLWDMVRPLKPCWVL